MRILATADLHFNHGKSHDLAIDLIDRMNREQCDALLVVGDTAAYDGEALEKCLERFTFAGPRLFVAGNHELWTHGPDSYANFRDHLPDRVRALGWQWLQTDPFVAGSQVAIVGSLGWYDFSFAQPGLKIPTRFYAAKVSPGAAQQLPGYESLRPNDPDVPDSARQIFARWNDGRFIHLHRTDEQFLDEQLEELDRQLQAVSHVERIVVAVHHLPFAQLLPPPHSAQWDFAKAYLGSARIGELLLRHTKVTDVVCGHSHFPAEAQIGGIRAINIGSGYRSKRFVLLDV